jgi:hypothetical protein
MKGITNFCKITGHDYVVVARPNGGLKATIDCVYPPHLRKIKEMAEDRGYTVDTSDCGEIVIYSDEGWDEIMEKFYTKCPEKKPCRQETDGNITIKNSHGEELNYEDVVDYMDDDIREYLHHQLAPCPPQYFYEEYCKLHKEIYGQDFELEDYL